MLATEPQAKRAYEELRRALVGYHAHRMGERRAAPEDVLLVQRMPINEGKFVTGVLLKVDVEAALLQCGAPFEHKLQTWEYLTSGGTWRGRVGLRWSMSETAVARNAEKTVWSMVTYLTGKRP